MTLIEEMAKQPPCPCNSCFETDCEDYARCPLVARWANWRQEAYKRHLDWMRENMTWRQKEAQP